MYAVSVNKTLTKVGIYYNLRIEMFNNNFNLIG